MLWHAYYSFSVGYKSCGSWQLDVDTPPCLKNLRCCPVGMWVSCCVCACWSVKREKTNKMQQSDVYYELLSQHVSGIIMPVFRRTKTVCYCIWLYCWMWLVAVVGRCVVGCEHTVTLISLYRYSEINVTFYSVTLAKTICLSDDGPWTETCRSVLMF